jgi:hypothetical protein
MALVEAGKIAGEVAAATYLAYDQTRRRIHVTLVSGGISCVEAAKIGATATIVFAGALQSALLRHGQSARVGVATQGADILATFKTKANEYAEVCSQSLHDV